MRSLVWATDIDVLAVDREVTRRDGYWAVRCPSNPDFYWGNLLIYDGPPAAGDRPRWMAAFAAEFPALRHRTFAWDVIDGTRGAADQEFPEFEPEEMVGLTAEPGQLVPHPRAHPDVAIHALGADDDEALWDQVLALREVDNAAADDPHEPAAYRTYALARQADLRALLRAGRGAWYLALEGDLVVGALGMIVTEGRARYQSVDTLASHRRRGIASRLVYAAAEMAARDFGPLTSLVIAAVPGYHALGIYESLGFRQVERVTGVCRRASRAPAGE